MLDKMVSEKRLTKRLGDYWERIRENNPIPVYEKFNTAAISDIMDFCAIISVDQHDPARIVFSFENVGSMITEAFGQNVAGKKVTSQIQALPGGGIAKKMEHCVSAKNFTTEDGKFINDKNKVVKYRSCLAPLGNKEGVVTHLVLGLSWKAF